MIEETFVRGDEGGKKRRAVSTSCLGERGERGRERKSGAEAS
jgi:hypothetical protein